MFTVKYRLSDGSEQISGPYDSISTSFDQGDVVVTAHSRDGTMTYGPIKARAAGEHPRVWVMNAQGATVATYDL